MKSANLLLTSIFFVAGFGHAKTWEKRRDESKARLALSDKVVADALNAFEQQTRDLKASLGHTPLAQEIIVWEEAAGRELPIRLEPGYCEAPKAYGKWAETGRFLVKCASKTDSTSKACLNVATNLFGEDLNKAKIINNGVGEIPATFRCERLDVLNN